MEKIRKQIFILIMILIIISIDLVGIFIIFNIHKKNIELQVEESIAQVNVIYSNYKLYKDIDSLIPVISQYANENIKIAIYEKDKEVFSNIEEEDKEIVNNVKNNNSKEINYILENETLYIALIKDEAVIITKTDVSNIYDFRNEQINFFARLSTFISIVILLLVVIIINIFSKKLNELDEKNNSQKEFINNLTHEIRTPLTSIIGFSSLLKNGTITDLNKVKEYGEKINKEGNYIKNLSDKLKELILLENKEKSNESINISKLLEEILSDFNIMFEDVIIESKVEKNCFKEADKELFKMLILNILKNAYMAYDKDNERKIYVYLKKNVIKIKDFGKGIKEENLEKIKQPLFTMNYDKNREISGMGLGLTICDKIIKYHNWDWKIESKENVGTDVIIIM